MTRTLLLVCLCAIIAIVSASSSSSSSSLPSVSFPSSSWLNEDIMRTIDLKTHIEQVTLSIKAKNQASSPLSSYIVSIPASKSGRLAYLDSSIGKTKLISRQVSVSGVDADKSKGASFFQIDLPKPVGKDETLSLTVFTVFTRTQVPFPEMIEQADNQLVQYDDSAVVYSVYQTEKQETLIQLFNNKVESYTKKHARKSGDEIRYGPFTSSVGALELSKPISIHSVNNSPFVTFNSLSKDIEVSHWGNVAVQDNYILTHTGAKLKGAFTRSDYERSRNGESAPASFRTLIAELPRTAKDIYYRDVIGNVSTSHVRKQRDSTRMEVDPRFPMFGGWESDFHIGYNLPSQHYLSVDLKDSDLYVLNISFAAPFSTAAIDSLAVRVILPEGARDIVWRTPFDIDSATYTEFKTYLDTSGRPTLILQKDNCVKFHQQHFQVAYRFDRSSILREPLLITAAVLLCLLVVIIFSHADLKIVDDDASSSSAASARASPLTTRRSGTDLGESIQQILENLLAQPNGLVAVSQQRGNVEKQTLVTSLVKEISASLKSLESEEAETFASIVTTLTNSLNLLAKSSKKYVNASNAAEIKSNREQLVQVVEQIQAQAEKLASL